MFRGCAGRQEARQTTWLPQCEQVHLDARVAIISLGVNTQRVLMRAITIHKMQSISLAKAGVDFGEER